MTSAGGGPDPDAARGPGPDRDLSRLLRWYPRAWRERYGEEFLAMLEDTVGDRGPGWRLQLEVAWAGSRQRFHDVLYGPTGKHYGNRWAAFVMAGCILAGTIADARRHPSAAVGTWQAIAVASAVTMATAATVTLAAIVAMGVAVRPSFVRFLRSGGEPKIRRQIAGAAIATVAAAGGLAWLIVLPMLMTYSQLTQSAVYGAAFSVTTPLFLCAFLLLTAAADAVAGHLDPGPRVLTAETRLTSVISTGVLSMVYIQFIWYAAIRSSVFWLVFGLVFLAGNSFAAAQGLWRARRSARRQGPAAAQDG